MRRRKFASIVSASLPKMVECTGIVTSNDTAIIHAPGFEDRTLSITDTLATPIRGSVFLLDYRPIDIRNKLHEMMKWFESHGTRVPSENIVEYDRFQPGDFEKRLSSGLKRSGATEVIVDVSTMSKLAILLVLKTCQSLGLSVRVLYSEAEAYDPSETEFTDAKRKGEIHRPSLQVYTGVHGVVRVSSLASVSMQGQPTAAIVFMSFNNVLTQVLLNSVYPARLFLINGKPPEKRWREEATAWIHDQVRAEWSDDNPVLRGRSGRVRMPRRRVSTLDYKETVTLLLDLYWELSTDHRIILAPSGSKMQAVGCFIVKALHPDIHVEYPSPKGFLSSYSTGRGKQWLLELGKIEELRRTIEAVERREFLSLRTMLGKNNGGSRQATSAMGS